MNLLIISTEFKKPRTYECIQLTTKPRLNSSHERGKCRLILTIM
jgi:hypothetical protein